MNQRIGFQQEHRPQNHIEPKATADIGILPVILVQPVADMPAHAQRNQHGAGKVDMQECPGGHGVSFLPGG
jgi:hypothetical protein